MVLPTDASPSRQVAKSGVKRPFPGHNGEGPTKQSAAKRKHQGKRQRPAGAIVPRVRVQRAKEPVGQPWPVRELRAFDLPFEVGWGKLLEDVLKARGWRFSTHPCHATSDEKSGKVTVHVKEFEACLSGQAPEAAFGKRSVVEEGYRLQALSLPAHALWMMGRMPFRVPGTAGGRSMNRDDFVEAVVDNAARLQGLGKPGNYRICKFPGTETALFKTNLTEAFRDKSWYPQTFILPKERDGLLRQMRAGGESRGNLWIAKPRNDYGGAGIRVFKGTDQDLKKLVDESEGQPRSVVQRYLADTLLVGGYKFHMRIHLLITSLDPLEAFVQENGQCLFATKPYTLSSKTLGASFDPPAHVTNMCLNATPENKKNFLRKKPVIGKGQQIRMLELEEYLADNEPKFERRKLWEQILEIGADTARYIASAAAVRKYGKLVPEQHFEIFGMDLMMDTNLKVWMCETNTDPGLCYPDKLVLGSPNPDYKKEVKACSQTWHDVFTLLGLDAGLPQTSGSLRHWYKLDFSDTRCRRRS